MHTNNLGEQARRDGAMARVVAGIDVGGTFTDLMLLDVDGVNGPAIRIAKTPTQDAIHPSTDFRDYL